MIGFNCVGIFRDVKGEIAAAYAGSPDFVVDIFRRSLDPEYCPAAVLERLLSGVVTFDCLTYQDVDGSPCLKGSTTNVAWAVLSTMTWCELLKYISEQFNEPVDFENCPLYAERIAYEQSRVNVGE